MKIALIGGTGSSQLFASLPQAGLPEETPFGHPSGSPCPVERSGYRSELVYLARHGPNGSIPPHRVNYRANLWALKQCQPDLIVGLNAVGGIAREAAPTRLVIPDQLIDYTWGREHTFSDGKLAPLQHVEFSEPFDAAGRRHLIDCADELGLDVVPTATYGVTQGPRLETAAEIDRLQRDGCDVVGMTAMPEAALARELGLAYAICAVVVNRAAGRGPAGDGIHAEMQRSVDSAMAQLDRLLRIL